MAAQMKKVTTNQDERHEHTRTGRMKKVTTKAKKAKKGFGYRYRGADHSALETPPTPR
jgi:hypothetical protein